MKVSSLIPLMALTICTSTAAFAADSEKDVAALEWQKQALKGITALKYRVAFDESASVGETVKASLAKTNIAAKESSEKEDKTALGGSEARIIVVVKNKDKDKSWVGLTVEQQCQLTRDASIKWDGETYRAGKVVERKKEVAAAKAICDDFVAAFNKVVAKKK